MRIRLALVVSILALVLGAGPGMAFGQTAPGSGDDVAQEEQTANSNETSQEANDEATTEQENSVELEGSEEGDRSNNGESGQSNNGAADATAENDNSTGQENTQDATAGGGIQEGAGSGDDVESDQDASNRVVTSGDRREGVHSESKLVRTPT